MPGYSLLVLLHHNVSEMDENNEIDTHAMASCSMRYSVLPFLWIWLRSHSKELKSQSLHATAGIVPVLRESETEDASWRALLASALLFSAATNHQYTCYTRLKQPESLALDVPSSSLLV